MSPFVLPIDSSCVPVSTLILAASPFLLSAATATAGPLSPRLLPAAPPRLASSRGHPRHDKEARFPCYSVTNLLMKNPLCPLRCPRPCVRLYAASAWLEGEGNACPPTAGVRARTDHRFGSLLGVCSDGLRGYPTAKHRPRGPKR